MSEQRFALERQANDRIRELEVTSNYPSYFTPLKHEINVKKYKLPHALVHLTGNDNMMMQQNGFSHLLPGYQLKTL